jgi:hypothetical protein
MGLKPIMNSTQGMSLRFNELVGFVGCEMFAISRMEWIGDYNEEECQQDAWRSIKDLGGDPN